MYGCGDVEKYKYIGFHGTNIKNAEKILGENQFRPSTKPDEWLGKGIYFFAVPEDAVWWCRTYKRLENHDSAILRVEIEADLVIDLLSSKLDIDNFRRFCDSVKNKCSRLPNGKARKNYMSLAIEMMIGENDFPVDMIIGGFNENRHSWYQLSEREHTQFPIVIAQVQYCIRNHKCIKRIEQYKEEGGTS